LNTERKTKKNQTIKAGRGDERCEWGNSGGFLFHKRQEYALHQEPGSKRSIGKTLRQSGTRGYLVKKEPEGERAGRGNKMNLSRVALRVDSAHNGEEGPLRLSSAKINKIKE